MLWEPNQGPYTTKDCYLRLLWSLKIPLKTKIFLWKFQHEILPTGTLLVSRTHNPNISQMCGWCHLQEENIDHLFFKCEIAKWAWDLIFEWWHSRAVSLNKDILWSFILKMYKGSPYKKA